MRRFTRILFSLPHNGGAHSAPARERRGAKGPRERPSRGVGRSPTLVSMSRDRGPKTRDRGPKTEDRAPGVEHRSSARWRPVLLLLFVGSGTAALIYEIVWFQLLQLVVGSSAISVGVLLGTFMGGMCLGSLLLPRVVPSRHHPLRVYALLEIGIGVIGVVVLLAMPLVGRLYAAWGGDGLAGILLRAAVAAVCLLPPTFLLR